jgi:hypothetical protein
VFQEFVCACLGNEGVLEIFSQSGRRKGNHTFQHQVDDVVVDKNGIFYVSSNFEKKILKIVNKNEEVFAETRICVRGLATDGNGGLDRWQSLLDSVFYYRQQPS